jgi:signal transduction histidine kinase
MRERSEGASGRFSIQSEPGQGTVITATWMLNASGSMHRAMQEQVMRITASPPAIQPDINLNEQSPSVRR